MSNFLENKTVCNLVQVDIVIFLQVFIGHLVAPRPTSDRLKDNAYQECNLFLPRPIKKHHGSKFFAPP